MADEEGISREKQIEESSQNEYDTLTQDSNIQQQKGKGQQQEADSSTEPKKKEGLLRKVFKNPFKKK